MLALGSDVLIVLTKGKNVVIGDDINAVDNGIGFRLRPGWPPILWKQTGSDFVQFYAKSLEGPAEVAVLHGGIY
jgi:hypothetical protein